jgi:hypothetical protein
MTAAIIATAMTSPGPDFEVTFVLTSGQRVETRVAAAFLREQVRTTAVPPTSGDTREELSRMLVSLIASGFENDNAWGVNDTSGVSWLFKQNALLAVEIRDPKGIGTKSVGFTAPGSDPISQSQEPAA